MQRPALALAARFTAASSSFHLGAVRFPAPSPQNDGTTFLDSNPQIIPNGSSNTKAAFDFISWEATNPMITAKFANTVANVPQLVKVPHFALESDPLFRLYEQEANSPQAHVWQQSGNSSTYATELCQAQSSALVGGKTAQAALSTVATQVGEQ
jgi:spermidine/putrescine-binding protein